MKYSPEETMKDIQDRMSAMMESFLYSKNTGQTRRLLLNTLMDTLSKILQDYGGGATINDIEIEVCPDKIDPSRMNIVPKNFFTFLLMYGIYYPFATNRNVLEHTPQEGPYAGMKFNWDNEKSEGHANFIN